MSTMSKPAPPSRMASSVGSAADILPSPVSPPAPPLELTMARLWPHSPEQSRLLFTLLDRIKSHRALLEDATNFFAAVEAADTTVAKEYRKALKQFRGLPNGVENPAKIEAIDESVVGPGLKGTVASFHALADQHQAYARHVRETTVKQLDAAISCHARKYKDLRTAIERESSAITKSRNETLIAIAAHVKAHSVMAARRASVGDLQDPWLTEMALHMQLLDNVDRENRYQAAMLAAIDAARECETHCLATLKQIVGEYLELRVTSMPTFRETLVSMQLTIAGYDATWPFASFSADTNLHGSPIWHTPRSVAAFPYRVEVGTAEGIARQGVILRQGTILKSKWKPSWFVLSDLGFLHCFEEKNPAYISPAPSNGSNGRTSSSLPRSPTEESGVGNGAKPKMPNILFSICLRQGLTAVNVATNKPYDHSFEIIVQPPRETGIFAIKKKEMRYLLKAESEESMVDWICAIKRLIAHYAPPPPPRSTPPATEVPALESFQDSDALDSASPSPISAQRQQAPPPPLPQRRPTLTPSGSAASNVAGQPPTPPPHDCEPELNPASAADKSTGSRREPLSRKPVPALPHSHQADDATSLDGSRAGDAPALTSAGGEVEDDHYVEQPGAGEVGSTLPGPRAFTYAFGALTAIPNLIFLTYAAISFGIVATIATVGVLVVEGGILGFGLLFLGPILFFSFWIALGGVALFTALFYGLRATSITLGTTQESFTGNTGIIGGGVGLTKNAAATTADLMEKVESFVVGREGLPPLVSGRV
ncbi:hypothetical protein H9P43_004116 [Blastocladiella emersonii ATCC 22665]|nr:hypothetical protein H9P43_004116 [Blastocladiella emersonii ATCC 22665]